MELHAVGSIVVGTAKFRIEVGRAANIAYHPGAGDGDAVNASYSILS